MNGISTSGTLADFFVYNNNLQIWNGTAFVDWTDGNFSMYRVPATEVGSSGRFKAADIPGGAFFELRIRGDALDSSPVMYEDKCNSVSSNTSTLVNSNETPVLTPVSPSSGATNYGRQGS